MRWTLLAAISVSPLLAFAGFGNAQTEDLRVSEPFVHENLAVYFVHGKSAAGRVPLTLDEALAKGLVRVRETGNVNQLEIENLGTEEVFVQSGDIVKGGKQDRVLMVSLLLPAKSGSLPIASFCVEEGRWTARGGENAAQFSTAAAALPSRELKLAMKAPRPAQPVADPTAPPRANSYAAETGERQREVWAGVRQTHAALAKTLGSPVRSAQSASSLQLALENEKLVAAQEAYVKALKDKGEATDDIVGYVFAVNGRLNSADLYPSNGLFRKMWAKLLTASAIEAISHRNEPNLAPPAAGEVKAFLAAAQAGNASEKPLVAGAKLETRDSDKAYYFETARSDVPGAAPQWVHRNYLAK
jgi:hypothetical protein